jgi:hypothetical protein
MDLPNESVPAGALTSWKRPALGHQARIGSLIGPLDLHSRAIQQRNNVRSLDTFEQNVWLLDKF